MQGSRDDSLSGKIISCALLVIQPDTSRASESSLRRGGEICRHRTWPRLHPRSGREVGFTFGTIAGVQQRLKDGETADVIIGTAPAIAQMEQSGVIEAGSRVELGRTLTGIGVRDDTPSPDISTPERFRQAMLDARSIAYTSPQAGGTSGIYLPG